MISGGKNEKIIDCEIVKNNTTDSEGSKLKKNN